MLLTVTPNAAIDKTYSLERFEIDKIHRPIGLRAVAGGKGVNVARVYHTLGGEAVATGFLGGYAGKFIADSLHEIGVPARFVETKEESRLCFAIIDTTTLSQTEINENGPNVTSSEVADLKRRFSDLLDEGIAQSALCGSLPPQCPASLYAELIEIARRKNAFCALDASGEALRLGIHEHPDLVKCNQLELRAVLPPFGDGVIDLAKAARSLLGQGTLQAAITMGGKGAIATDAESAWFAAPPSIHFVSAVGSGDSFLAAYLYYRERGESLSECLAWGVAAGAANASVMGAGFCERPEIERLKATIRCERISLSHE